MEALEHTGAFFVRMTRRQSVKRGILSSARL
jgi:hypothetical protein